MPNAERYAQYRAEQTTIWVGKSAFASLVRERQDGESTAAVVDRLLRELRALRRQAVGKKGSRSGRRA